MARRPAAVKKGLSINFEGVESSGVLPEGGYILEVAEIEQKTSTSSGGDYLAFVFKVTEGNHAGKKVFHNCSLQPQALFNLRSVLEALGFAVPAGVMELDPDDLVGAACGGAVQHELYEGKRRPRIVEFFPADELTSAEEAAPAEEETPAPAPAPAAKAPAKKKAAAKPAPKAPAFKVGDKVKFLDDEGEEQLGKITAIDDDTVALKVGRDEWEVSVDELTPA